MNPMDAAGDDFVRADKLRRLRLQLAETTEEAQRHVILRQIEELEDEAKRKLSG